MEVVSHDLLVHGVSILQDISLANLAYREGDFKDFGKIIAKIMKLVTVASEAKMKETETSEAKNGDISSDNLFLF